MNALTTTGTQVNETLETIYQRRSIRKYKNESVSRDLIEQVIDAGRMAPSAINMQEWKFYVLTNKARILAISGEIAKVAERFFHMSHGVDISQVEDFIFHGAPVVIFLTAPRDNEWAGLDTGLCAGNMMLAARSLGLDTCPVGLAKFVEQTEGFSKLNIPKEETVMLAVILGYGDEHVEAHERKRDNAVFIEVV
jgi:nitroreductase